MKHIAVIVTLLIFIIVILVYSFATGARCKLVGGYPDPILEKCILISEAALLENVDPDLFASAAWVESGGDVSKLSTWTFICRGCTAENTADERIKQAVRKLGTLMRKYGDESLALRNFGPYDPSSDGSVQYAQAVLKTRDHLRPTPTP